MMEDQLLEIERAANFLRGLWLDPAVPAHAKGAIMETAERLEKAVEELQSPTDDDYMAAMGPCGK